MHKPNRPNPRLRMKRVPLKLLLTALFSATRMLATGNGHVHIVRNPLPFAVDREAIVVATETTDLPVLRDAQRGIDLPTQVDRLPGGESGRDK